MNMTVRKWGNSLAVRIPKSFAEEAGLTSGSNVDLALVEGKLIISPVEVPRFTLEDLLAGVTDANLHPEQDFGSIEGREAW